ncbi:MAG: Maf family protein, partial [Actinomycetes bacterium]
HQVHSGVCLIINGSQRTGIETTAVRFQSLSDQQIGQYVATDEWRGRAGGYAIQSGGQRLVESVIGDLDNVIGLPLDLLLKLAPELAIN